MKIPAALALCAALAPAAISGERSGQQPATFRFRNLVVENIGSSSFDQRTKPYATLTSKGLPKLRATLAQQGQTLTLTAASLVASLDPAAAAGAPVLRTASMTGGVLGGLSNPAASNLNSVRVAGDSLTYTDASAKGVPGEALGLTGGADFTFSNASGKGTLHLSGAKGDFLLGQAGAQIALRRATVAGPVRFEFSAARVGGTRPDSGASGHGRADSLAIERAGTDGSEYRLRLVGNVDLEGAAASGAGTWTGPAVTLVLDAAFDVLEVDADQGSTATLTPAKHG